VALLAVDVVCDSARDGRDVVRAVEDGRNDEEREAEEERRVWVAANC
jgi:hypothetical protein